MTRLAFLLFFIGLSGFSQRLLTDRDYSSLRHVVPDTLNNKVYLFYDHSFDELELPSLSRKTFGFYSDADFLMEERIPVLTDSGKFFVKNGGGTVYALRNDSIKRIDQSFDHKMQWQASFFVHKGRIFAYGGYGFWSVRDFFIYFDESLKEWELLSPGKLNTRGPAIFGGFFVKSGDDFYVGDGFTINQLNRTEKLNNYEVWHFSFDKNQWTYLGRTDNELHRAGKGATRPFGSKETLYMLNTNHIEVCDLKNNRRTLYKHGLQSTKAGSDLSTIFMDNNEFYIVRNENEQVKIERTEADQFLGDKITEGIFYKNRGWWIRPLIFYVILPLLLLVGLWKLYLWYRKTRKVLMVNNGLLYRNKFVECDEESMLILKTLLQTDITPSNEILRIVEKDQFSQAHNERIKIQKISDLNIKIQTLLGVNKDIINSVKSKDDKRIRQYKINKSYFHF